MARVVLTVPRALMRSTRIQWTLDHRGQEAGPTTNNINQTFYSAFPRWVGAPRLHLRRETVLQWRAIISAARGREKVLRLPMIDPLGSPWDVWAGEFAQNGVPLSGGQTLSNDQGFAYTPFALAVGAAAQGATQLTVDHAPTGQPVQAGQIISHDDWPVQVTAVLSQTGTRQVLQIEPGLRVAVSDGDTVHTEAFGLFELVDPNGAMPHYARDHRATPEVALREALTR